MAAPLPPLDPTAPPGLRLLGVVAACLLLVAGGRFAFYAALNRRDCIPAQRVLWEYLAYAGASAAVHGGLGLASLTTPVPVTVREGPLLAAVLLLSLATRELYYAGTVAASERQREGSGKRRVLEFAFVTVALAVTVRAGLGDVGARLAAVEAAAAIGFAVYGVAFARRHLADPARAGTTLDTVVRHVLVLSLFVALPPVVDLAALADIDPVVVAHFRVVFEVMAATAALTAAIPFHQTLGGR